MYGNLPYALTRPSMIPIVILALFLSKKFNRIISMREMRMPTARLDMRLNEEIKIKAEKASALLGLKSLTDYVVKLIDNNELLSMKA